MQLEMIVGENILNCNMKIQVQIWRCFYCTRERTYGYGEWDANGLKPVIWCVDCIDNVLHRFIRIEDTAEIFYNPPLVRREALV